MLVHLSALARVAHRLDTASAEERELILELETLLALRLVHRGSGALTAEAMRLAPASGATLAAADAFFELAESLGGEPSARSAPSVTAPPERLATVGPATVRTLHT